MKVKEYSLKVKVVLPESIDLSEEEICEDVEVLIDAWAHARLGYVSKVKLKKAIEIDTEGVT